MTIKFIFMSFQLVFRSFLLLPQSLGILLNPHKRIAPYVKAASFRDSQLAFWFG